MFAPPVSLTTREKEVTVIERQFIIDPLTLLLIP